MRMVSGTRCVLDSRRSAYKRHNAACMHLTERFTRTDFDTLKYEVTIDDKGAYTRPWSGGWNIKWQYTNYDGSPGGEIHEYFCIDNERDSQHFAGQ